MARNRLENRIKEEQLDLFGSRASCHTFSIQMLTYFVHRCTMMDMLRTTSSQLKAKLGKFMRAVRGGKEVIITDRDQPVARLVPYRPEQTTPSPVHASQPRDPAAPALGDVEIKAIHYGGPSTTELLQQDRQR